MKRLVQIMYAVTAGLEQTVIVWESLKLAEKLALQPPPQVKQQIGRAPYALPSLHIEDRGQSSIDDFSMDDLALVGYESHGAIKAEMAV